MDSKGEDSFDELDDDGDNDGDDDGDDVNNTDDLLQDRGWAWFVMLGCFLSHLITGGLERSDGVFFLKLTARYGGSAQVTAWAGALSATLMQSMGPVASALSNRYSARTSVMVGALFYSMGLICSGLAPDMPSLLVCFGLVQGFGRGLTYAPGLVITGMYFNRRRGLGVGLATAGVGAGTFILPPLVEFLFEEFGFQGAFLILGGIALNLCFVAMLYRPLFVHRHVVLGRRRRGGKTMEELLGRGGGSDDGSGARFEKKMLKKKRFKDGTDSMFVNLSSAGDWKGSGFTSDSLNVAGPVNGETDKVTVKNTGQVDSENAVGLENRQKEIGIENSQGETGLDKSQKDIGLVNNQKEIGLVNNQNKIGSINSQTSPVYSQTEKMANGRSDPCLLGDKESGSPAKLSPFRSEKSLATNTPTQHSAPRTAQIKRLLAEENPSQRSRAPADGPNKLVLRDSQSFRTKPWDKSQSVECVAERSLLKTDTALGQACSVLLGEQTNSEAACLQDNANEDPDKSVRLFRAQLTHPPGDGVGTSNGEAKAVGGHESNSSQGLAQQIEDHLANGDYSPLVTQSSNTATNLKSVSLSALSDDVHIFAENGESTSSTWGRKTMKLVPNFVTSCLTTCFPSEGKSAESNAKKKKLLDWTLLRDPAFLFYGFSICLFTVSLKSSLIFLPPLVKSKGVSDLNAAYLLSISGVLDTIGRITTGVVLELKHVRHFRPIVFNGFIFAICALLAAVPFLSTFVQFGVAFALFGFLTGAYVCQKSVVLVDLLGMDKLGSSFGLLIFFQGVGNFIGPPLSGVLKDTLGQYTEVFFLGAASLALSGVLMIISNFYVARAIRSQRKTLTVCSVHT
ncbi:uncharacterized protein [Littorina saxatilis]